MEIPYPTYMAKGTCTVSCMVTGHLSVSLWGHVKFRSGGHVQILTDGTKYMRWHKAQEVKEDLSTASVNLSLKEILSLHFRRKIGSWISVVPSTLNGTEIGAK